MNKKKIKIAIALNIIIVLLTILAIIVMFFGIKFMNTYDSVLETSKVDMFKFFTVQSNIFIAVVAFIFMLDEIKILKKDINAISLKKYILKLSATTAVGLTFFVVFTYLGPISKNGIFSLLMNSNLFFHLIIPLLSIIVFAFFEKTDKIKFKYNIYSIIPVVIYTAFYLTNILIHMKNGKVSPIYDWYWFVQNGIWSAFIVIPLMLFITFFISVILWKLNKIK